jgi:hypothetical protein
MTVEQPEDIAQAFESEIFFLRGEQVMLGAHLAQMYEVNAEALGLAVECNFERFPVGSVFRLEPGDMPGLDEAIAQSQAAPYAFTAAGIAMLASLLLDEGAISGGDEACAPACSCRSGR